MKEENEVLDESGDKKYFTMIPRIVWAKCRSPYDLTLWLVIKDISGQTGECYLSTRDLAQLAMMSKSQVQRSREYLIKAKLLYGKKKKEVGYPAVVWHLRVPDLWKENTKWAESHIKIAERIDWKSAQGIVPTGDSLSL